MMEMIEGYGNRIHRTWKPVAWLKSMHKEVQIMFTEPFHEGAELGSADLNMANEKLMKSRYRFSKVFDDAGAGMFITNLEGTIILVNDVFCRMVGYTENEILGMNMSEFNNPDEEAIEPDAFMGMLAGNMNKIRYDKCFKGKNGKIIWAILDAAVIRDWYGMDVCAVGQTLDITDSPKIEVLLEEFHHRMKNNMPTISSFSTFQDQNENSEEDFRMIA